MTQGPPTTRRFRDDFRQQRWNLVRIRPTGFEIEGESHDELRGRVAQAMRIRKLFEDGVLACQSTDGVQSVEGVQCATCAHPACRPLLRVHLADDIQVFILDLPHSSARNLMRLEDEVAELARPLTAIELIAEVQPRGYWGEVTFRPA